MAKSAYQPRRAKKRTRRLPKLGIVEKLKAAAAKMPKSAPKKARPEPASEADAPRPVRNDAPVQPVAPVTAEAPRPAQSSAPVRPASSDGEEGKKKIVRRRIVKKKDAQSLPKVDQLQAELNRISYRQRFRRLLRSTVNTLIVVAAAAVLVAVLFMPVLRIYGSSMVPTLAEGEIVVSVKGKEFKQGDIVAVYYGSKVLVKRCIATEYQWVNVDADGNVYVDEVRLDEPYVDELALGETNIELPYQVPDGTIFVMGDHRKTSIDSRNSSVGCISTEDVVGKIVFRVWPLKEFGGMKKY